MQQRQQLMTGAGSAHVLHIWWENGAERFDCGYSHTKYEGLTVPVCFQVP